MMNMIAPSAQRISPKHPETKKTEVEWKSVVAEIKSVQSGCLCPSHEHINPRERPNDDEIDEMEIHAREWKAHTVAYRDGWNKMTDDCGAAEMNSTDYEIHREEWENTYHPKLCCDLRHFDPSRGLCWSE